MARKKSKAVDSPPDPAVQAKIAALDDESQKLVNRYLLDVAMTGLCGDKHRTDPVHVRSALVLSERADMSSLASAEPLKDLHWILENGDSEQCAQSVGAAWRTAHPFRTPAEGDPYSVLAPHVNRAMALAALDRAATLPALPPMGLVRQAYVVDELLSAEKVVSDFYCYTNSCNEAVARDLVVQALDAYQNIQDRQTQLATSVLDTPEYTSYLESLHAVASALRSWLAGARLSTARAPATDAHHIARNAQLRVPSLELDLEQTRRFVESLQAYDVSVGRGARFIRDENDLKELEERFALYSAMAADVEDTRIIQNATAYIDSYSAVVYDKEKKLEARRAKRRKPAPVVVAALQEATPSSWFAPVAFVGTIVGGLALAFAFVKPERS